MSHKAICKKVQILPPKIYHTYSKKQIILYLNLDLHIKKLFSFVNNLYLQ